VWKKILKTITKLGHTYDVWRVFNDFLELSALSVVNSLSLNDDLGKRHEQQYSDIMTRYSPEEQKLFPELFSKLVEALEQEVTSSGPSDVLGTLFHELKLHNKYKGQFFTPQSLGNGIGLSAFGSEQETCIKQQGYISLLEPCCGSGVLALGFAKAMANRGFNYCTQLVVTAVDVDIKCVYMCYLQLSLYGIPGIVIHGNTLALEEWFRWYTPAYVFGGWRRKV